ncbi:ribonuclease III [Candidatus Curtissbacteria bacterium]|nr:ribonuclease III [Candidatus Curtissbacteria bacterium]
MKTSTKSDNLSETIEKKLALKFKDPDILKNAFVHRSYLNEHKDYQGDSNERLEFLGDSVLSLAVSNFLFAKLTKSPEGELTQIRASLVRTETLAIIATKLELGVYLFLSKGEEDSGGRTNKSILANTFEALVGALYLDQGFDTASTFIAKHILGDWKKLSEEAASDNKSKLQEVLQRKFHRSPVYKLIESWGPDHDRSFKIGVYLDEKILGEGNGKNKQTAAQDAAGNALAKLK